MSESAVNIIQPLSPTIKQDTVDLSIEGKTAYDVFISKLREVESDFLHNKEKPYDYRAAKTDYEQERNEKFRSHPSKYGGNINAVMLHEKDGKDMTLQKFDFQKYGDESRFTLEKESPVMEDKLLDGIRESVETGIYKDYRSKVIRNKISVFCKKKKK